MKINLRREGGLATIKPASFLQDNFDVFRKAIEGSFYDGKRKLSLATIDKVPGILTRLRDAGFEANLTDDLAEALEEHSAQLWVDVQAAKERVALIDAEIKSRTGKAQGLFPYQMSGATWLSMKHGALLGDEQGLGKEQPVSEPVLTPDGWRAIGDLKVGDWVIGSSGEKTRVLGVYPQGVKPVFRVTLNDGTWTRAGADHLWRVWNNNDRRTGGYRVMTTKELLSRKKDRWWIPLVNRVHFSSSLPLPVHPYALGALLANGCLVQEGVATHSGTDEQREVLRGFLPLECVLKETGSACTTRLIVKANEGKTANQPNELTRALKKLGLWKKRSWEKRVPPLYLFASAHDRILLLQGLMDNDGTISRDGATIEYNTTSEGLADDVMHLLRSLGQVAWRSVRRPSFVYKGAKKEGRLDYRIRMMLDPSFIPFLIPSKASRVVPRTKYLPGHAIESIEPCGEEESVCIRVEAQDRLYVTRNFIVTHNSLQVIAALPARAATLVVSPSVAKGVWRRETKTWRPTISTRTLEGLGSFVWPRAGEMIIMNYELLQEAHTPDCLRRRKSETPITGKHGPLCQKARQNVFIPAVMEMAKKCPGCLPESAEAKLCEGCHPYLQDVPEGLCIVADEAHALKNPNSQRTIRFRGLSNACRKKHGRVWLLTGTPLLNKPPELWSVLAAAQIAGDAFGTYKEFVEFFNGKAKRFGGYTWGTPDPVQVAGRMQRVMLRRLREEVMPELPKKTVQIWPVELSASLKKQCDAALEKIGGADELEKLITKGASFNDLARIRAALATAKMPAMLELIEELEEQDEPVVVFSAHRAPIDHLAQRKGWAVITGDTSPEERTAIEDRFQAGELRGVGATIKAGGVAITLTRACRAIFVDLDWTPGLNQQAEDRICRIGQKRPVLITVLTAEHPLDERVSELLEEKVGIIDASVNAAREQVQVSP